MEIVFYLVSRNTKFKSFATCRMHVRDQFLWSRSTLALFLFCETFTGLPVDQRVVFKLLPLAHNTLHRNAPHYLVDRTVVLSPSLYNLRRNNNGILLSHPVRSTVIRLVTERSRGRLQSFDEGNTTATLSNIQEHFKKYVNDRMSLIEKSIRHLSSQVEKMSFSFDQVL